MTQSRLDPLSGVSESRPASIASSLVFFSHDHQVLPFGNTGDVVVGMKVLAPNA